MNWRVFVFIILPILLLSLFGYFLLKASFEYIGSYIIACATLMSAMIAIFISKTNESIESKRIEENRSVFLTYFTSIIEKGAESISAEIQDYGRFISQLSESGMSQVPLLTTPLHFLRTAAKEFGDKYFDAILGVKSLEKNEAKRSYLEMMSDVNNAIFIRDNAHSQYKEFIISFNEQAKILRTTLLNFNRLHIEVMNTEEVPNRFSQEMARIVGNFNQGVNDGNIDFYSTTDHRTHILTPVRALLNDTNPGFMFFGRLHHISLEHEVVLNKIDEIQSIVSEHFSSAVSNLTEIQTRIRNRIQMLSS